MAMSKEEYTKIELRLLAIEQMVSKMPLREWIAETQHRIINSEPVNNNAVVISNKLRELQLEIKS
jgi:hypothetical protein